MKPYLRVITLLALAILLPLLRPVSAAAANPISVQAVLSQNSAEVGEAIDFQIVVKGSQNAAPPRDIQVDGLQISFSGPQAFDNIQVINGQFTREVTVAYNYSVLPNKAGTFTIPSLKVEVDGKTYSTQPLALTVAGSGIAGGAGGGDDKLAFAELVMPKAKAYVGEVIPVEFRVYLDARIRWQVQEFPQVSGEGFTSQKLNQPIQNQVQKNGRIYHLLTLKTALSPAKTGRLGIGPLDIQCLAQIPQKRARPRFGPDPDIFDSMFNDPMGIFNQTPARRVTIHSERTELEVLPLPPNAPKSFNGAVGAFSLSTKASPTKVDVGDPITLTLSINGRGNFDRVNAPKLMDETNWRSYPANAKFQADDDIGISGTKTFEMAIVPGQVQATLPLVEFSYFDPLTEKYVTLHADREPLTIVGAKPATPAVAPNSATPNALAKNAPSASPSPAAPKEEDIRFILTGPAQWNRSFEPIFASNLFWEVQLVPLLALLGLTVFGVRNARKADLESQRLAGLRQQKERLLKSMESENVDPKAFFDSAVQYLQLETATTLRSNTPSAIDAGHACSSRPLDPATQERIRSIFNACDEFRYAGSSRVAEKVAPEKRAEVLQTLKEFDRHA
jgi:hypothetical protein